jgi:hypothetical protein
MIKFWAKLDDGKLLVGLGLSEGNCQKLRDGQPMVFPATEVGIEDHRKIVIIYDDDDFRSAMEGGGFDSNKVAYCLVVDDDAIVGLRKGQGIINKVENVEFVFLYGQTEQELESKIRPYINEHTLVKRTGFPPSAPGFREQN